MSFAKVFSAQTHLLKAQSISVEVDISRGLHSFNIVGLPDKAVEESRDRVSAALKNSGFIAPKTQNQKTVISLAPADLKKEGPGFDVPIALAYLLAQGEILFDPEEKLFVGELSLDGKIQKGYGILPIIIEAKRQGFTEVYVPKENHTEATLVNGISVYGIETFKELVHHLNVKKDAPHETLCPLVYIPYDVSAKTQGIDFRDIRGQEAAKRGLEIAAAGGHNVGMWGPPGTGKTLLAKALAGILPPLSFEHMLEVTSIYSIVGTLTEHIITHPPFRAPHHTSSYVSLIGGGTLPRPGEITLAHRGVLFLDEFPEFDRRVIESLRQPLEERYVSVSRAKGSAQFPADVMVVIAMNPCPCGNWGNDNRICSCAPQTLQRYQKKISGPLVDRIDMWFHVSPVDHKTLLQKSKSEGSNSIQERVISARDKQRKRFCETILLKNTDMGAKEIETFVSLSQEVVDILNQSAEKLQLSARSYHRVIKLARTIADLEESEHIDTPHILEALGYRPHNLFV